jgi:hypothetical protein
MAHLQRLVTKLATRPYPYSAITSAASRVSALDGEGDGHFEKGVLTQPLATRIGRNRGSSFVMVSKKQHLLFQPQDAKLLL